MFNRNSQTNPQAHPRHQRFFGTRGPELLPIQREVIHADNPFAFKAKEPVPISQALSDIVTASNTMTPSCAQPSLPWPMLSASNINSLMMATNTQQASAMSSPEPFSMQPQTLLMSNMASIPMPTDFINSLALALEPMGNSAPSQQQPVTAMSSPSLNPPLLPLQNTLLTVSSEQPYSTFTKPLLSNNDQKPSQRQRKLCYLKVHEFRMLQNLIREHGEDWDKIGMLMGVRPGDLAKNWPGYSVDTLITSDWTKSEMQILALCRNLRIPCRATAKIIGTKLPLQCRSKTLKRCSTKQLSTKAKDKADESEDDRCESDGSDASSVKSFSPVLRHAQVSQVADHNIKAGSDDIQWDTGHGEASYEPRLLMPTADSAVVTDKVKKCIEEHGKVDWRSISFETGFPLKYCLEMNMYNADKKQWVYDAQTFKWEQAEALKVFITQFYPAPTPIDFLAVSNFFWINLPSCIEMYEMLRGAFEWTASDLGYASQLATQGWEFDRIARQLSPTMGGKRVFVALQQCRVREPEIQIPIQVDEQSQAQIRLIVEQQLQQTDINSNGVDVLLMLEKARKACCHLPTPTADRCTLAILTTFPQFSTRSNNGAHRRGRSNTLPRQSQSPLCDPPQSPPSMSFLGAKRISGRWTPQETKLLVQYAQSTKTTKNWKYFANLLGTKTPSQCNNKYRAMRKQKQLK
ncbi:hypothetical protein LPJ78_005189 [Coemansia sp. RSA 989]|nr:hypothetical protein BX667DRAFT_502548 [Coemansia mojavensis]KAJ1741328.1 hypothetical protein LPJ68_002930 [Coemansia sp. RSA 1086]KAJ1749565.1 hypothetical protein LPJ79_003603 [Coemansia sp. RSA 1821]KAJ1861685.1 hypothetical protein LPJ78_005189 [Coemansia sp. RSA 989]KAJ1871565.1 hypothetical protein LPJ55_003807 [Coemansia sp. RSA 990]KAJ2631177.1 hypothetical protein H4R22_002160 [Coemansia sp. RSA 1290]KAJ2646916.1 hypothetical protein IWW40_005089 [Coemansia sp. RSA 1250]KAJ26687